MTATSTDGQASGAAVDTSSVGQHTLTVTATSTDGQSAHASISYTVVPAPAVSAFTQSHRRWRAGNALARISRKRTTPRPPVGTTFGFTLNEPATVTLTFTHSAPGHKVKGRCVAPTRHAKRNCSRTLTDGRLTFAAHTGSNKLTFASRLSSRRKLGAGSYAVTITAVTSGLSSRPRSLHFTIVR